MCALVWVDAILKPENLVTLFQFCEAPHGNPSLKIHRLLIHFPSAALLKDSKDGSGNAVTIAAMRDFNKQVVNRHSTLVSP